MFFRLAIVLAALVWIASCDRSALAADAPVQPAKPDFEPIKSSILPQDVRSGEGNLRLIKPGHWSTAVLETKANNFDFLGELDSAVKQTAEGSAVDLPHTPYQLQIARPAILPKGQPKRLEFPLLVPDDCTHPWLADDLCSRGGAQLPLGSEPLSLLQPYQYFLVVLAGEPDRYRPLEAMDSIRAPHGGDALNYYRVVAPPLKQPLPLPSDALAWSSIAYVIWDDVDPQLLSPAQQAALVDWLHQGGQLIISGPKSLDQLGEHTILHDYLPALPGDPMKISAATLAELNRRWTLKGKSLAPSAPWNGITLKPQPGAQLIPGTGDLLVQKQVGRGRIVITSFRLTERELWDWPSFDGFLNGCLLLRPPRKFSATGLLGALTANWSDAAKSPTDPNWLTNVRYLTRDWRSETKPPDEAPDVEMNPAGVGGWTDFSDVANSARTALQDAAGIVIPNRGFVTRALALYLIVLVPLNWLLFWAIRRVEWAWIAAPVIAIVSMVLVVKFAQLDIGFARSQTEIDVLEIHNDYPRALLTRYVALYTSLSTDYEVRLENQSGFILPFSADPNFTMLPGQASRVVTFSDDPHASLSGFSVASNSTGLLHCEQMTSFGRPLSYQLNKYDQDEPFDAYLFYCLPYRLNQAAVLRRTIPGEYQVAWLGDIGESSNKLTFQRYEDSPAARSIEDTNSAGGEKKTHRDINLDRLAALFRAKQTLQPGEVRLVGVIPQPLKGLIVEPAASQSPRGATLVVAYLQEPPLPEPSPDVNTRGDVVSPRADVSSLVQRQ